MSEEQEDSNIVTPDEAVSMCLSEAIAAKIASMTDAEKDDQLTIIYSLHQFEAFTDFVEAGWDIVRSIDHVNKTVNVAVIEKPKVEVVDYKAGELGLDVAKSLKCQMLLKNNGVTKTAEVLKEVYKILGGRAEDAIVASASDSDISKELDAIRAAGQFKV